MRDEVASQIRAGQLAERLRQTSGAGSGWVFAGK